MQFNDVNDFYNDNSFGVSDTSELAKQQFSDSPELHSW